MVRKQEKLIALENFADHDTYHDVVLARAAVGVRFVGESFEFKSCEVDMDYKHFLLSIMSLDEKSGPVKKQKEMRNHVIGNNNDRCIEEETDPDYELFLKNLKEHEKSYVLRFEGAGSPGVIKYEREISSDEECDSDRSWRLSDTKQDHRIQNQMPHIENQRTHLTKSTSVELNRKLAPRESKKVVKNQKVEGGKHATTETVPDLDYLTLLQSSKFVDDYFVCTSGSAAIVYEKNGMENNQKKDNSEDECSSDIEILDIAAFYKKGKSKPSMDASPKVIEHMHEDIFQNLSGQTMQSRFRRELVAVLRKPYDKEEHQKLLRDIEIRKPQDRHRDLRGGREMSCSTAKIGKSFIDRFPGLQKQLLTFQNDRPKCLNLLRGFFFWLQNCPQEESFQSWMDAECLAISPEVQEESFESWMDAECLATSPEVCHPQFSPKKRRKI